MNLDLDLNAPGAVDELLARHRAVFGDARMESEAPPAEAAAAAPAAPAAPAAAAAAPAAAAAAPAAPAAPAWDGKVESLPEPVQKMIRDLRTEAGDERVATKTLQQLQKLLDPEAATDDKPDPAKLQQQLDERDRAHTALESDYATLRREHEVMRAALAAGADHDALLDSRTFMKSVATVDPAGDGFSAEIAKAVKDALANNPKLAAARVAAASGADLGGGSGERTKQPMTLDQAVRSHYGS